jgi:hypothetical protein
MAIGRIVCEEVLKKRWIKQAPAMQPAERKVRREPCTPPGVGRPGRRGLLAKQSGCFGLPTGDYAATEALYLESLALRREQGDKQSIALLLKNRGIIAQTRGDYDAARALHWESLMLRRELGEMCGVAASLAGLAGLVVRNAQQDLQDLPTCVEEGIGVDEGARTLNLLIHSYVRPCAVLSCVEYKRFWAQLSTSQ